MTITGKFDLALNSAYNHRDDPAIAETRRALITLEKERDYTMRLWLDDNADYDRMLTAAGITEHEDGDTLPNTARVEILIRERDAGCAELLRARALIDAIESERDAAHAELAAIKGGQSAAVRNAP